MDMPPEVSNNAPSVLGSLTALLFIKTTWLRKIGYFVAGIALSKFLAPTMHNVIGTSLEAALYISAVFGLAIIEKLYDMISNLDAKAAAADLWNAIVARVKG